MPIPTVEEKLRALKPEPPTDFEQACMVTLRPGDYEIGVQWSNDILDEGMQVFERCCRSSFGITGDSMVAVLTARGDVANGASGTYLHTIIQPIIVKYILTHYRDNPGIKDGDFWYTSDALYGGIHNPDRLALMPVFYQERLIAWVSAIVHTTETGALEPGGMPPSARSRFEEGLNLPPVKIGEDFKLREDLVEMYTAFGIRAPQMVITDLRARCSTVDRVRRRLVEMADKEGVEFVVGLLRKMVEEAEAGARRRIYPWPDGTYRCVNFNDTIGVNPGLNRACLTVKKQQDRLVFDMSGTSPETPTSYNAHPQAAVACVAQIVYEMVFHDLPLSNGTFASIDFIFPTGSFVNPDIRAATGNVVQIGTNLMSLTASCLSKMIYATTDATQVGASKAVSGNGHFVAGVSQWGVPFSDALAFQLNTRGQGGRPSMDGMNACGMTFCPTGRSPDVEFSESELPLLIPLSSHWQDSCGHGKYRGGVGTVQILVAYGAPEIYMVCTGPCSKLQNVQPLFGGYAPLPTPGITIRQADILERLRTNTPDLELALQKLLDQKRIDGQWDFHFRAKSVQRYEEGDVLLFAFTTGGAGYGDPLERDPELVRQDLNEQIVSDWSARNIYKVVYDSETRSVNHSETEAQRIRERQDRLKRARPFSEFVAQWQQKKPPEEALQWYGSWPDAKPIQAIVRP